MSEARFEVKAVEMTRRIRDAHFERLRDATRAERLAFFNRAARDREREDETPNLRAPDGERR